MISDLQEAKDPSIYGKKITNLARLYNDFDVPRGFAISSEKIKDIIKKGNDEHNQRKRAQIINSNIPGHIKSEIRERYENLIKPEGIPDKAYDLISGREVPMVSVRPSVIPFKKGVSNAFLNIPSSQSLFEAIKKCAASFYSDKAELFDLQGMGIMVQKMVDIESSGFVYSSHPTGEGVLVESNFGFGESITQGASCDRFLVNDYGIEKQVRKKKVKQVSDNLNGHTKRENILEKNSKKPSISERKIEKLSQIAKKLEGMFGTCFFEFGVVRDKVFIFQCNTFDKQNKEKVMEAEKIGEGISVSLGKAEGEVSFTPERNKILVSENPTFPKEDICGLITRRGNFSSHPAFLCRQLGVPYMISDRELERGQSIVLNSEGIYKKEIEEFENEPSKETKEVSKTENIKITKVKKLIEFFDGEAIGDGAFVRNVDMDTLRNIADDYQGKEIWYSSDIYEASDANIKNVKKSSLIGRPASLMDCNKDFLIVDINKINSSLTGKENQSLHDKTISFIGEHMQDCGSKERAAINFKPSEENVYKLIKAGFTSLIVSGPLVKKTEQLVEKCEKKIIMEVGRRLLRKHLKG